MQTILNVSDQSPHTEADAFFRGADHDAADDASYYLCYRHSTNHGAVVKSFVVMRRPVRDVRTTFIFNEFVGGGEGGRFIDHLYRESEGVVFRMERAFYLLGSNFNVPVDKRIDPDFYAAQRRRARWKPNALTMHVFEYDDVRLGPGLFGGVTLNVADLCQPLVSRVAMLHLGVRSLLGRTLTDDLLRPGEMRAEEMAVDLHRIVTAMREEGCRRFGHQVEKALVAPSAMAASLKRSCDQVLRMIDNTPAWEVKLASEGQGRRRVPVSRGALETFGAGRPRD